MTFEEIYTQLKMMFQDADVSHIHEHVAIQFNIQGEGCGAFYAEVKEGKLNIEPYEYHDRDVALTANADTFLKIANRKMDPILAFTLKKLKVDGDIGKALLIKDFIGKDA